MDSKMPHAVWALHARSYGEPGDGEIRTFFAPARINLIGEHIDYCGGLVLPAAIQFGTVLVARSNDLGVVRVVSLNQPGNVEFEANDSLQAEQPRDWGDYIKGVFFEYAKLGANPRGIDIAIGGDIPGGGLSSSASLEIGIALVVEAFTGFRSSSDAFENLQAMSWLAQRAENHFVGMNCGIMDQGAVALGKAGHAMLMNCSDLSVTYVPVDLGDYCLLIVNSGKDRNLHGSPYNARRRDVEQALDMLQPIYSVDNLCQLDIEVLDEALVQLADPVLARRTRHVVTEHDRVQSAAACLANGDIEGFGQLLDASHASLRYDYEVTGPELDALIAAARQQEGVLGARMMGGGFGGCGIALLEKAAVPAFEEAVGAAYKAEVGRGAEFYAVTIGPGAHELPAGVS